MNASPSIALRAPVRSSEEGIFSPFLFARRGGLLHSTFRTPDSALPAPRFARGAFTLVEILVVICVVAVLLAVSMPAFEKLVKGQGPGLAASELTGTLKAARAYALTKRVTVAIIFPRGRSSTGCPPPTMPGGGGCSNPELGEDYSRKAYRVCVIDGATTGRFLYWVPNEKWRWLPTGVAVLQAYSGSVGANTKPHTQLAICAAPDCYNTEVVTGINCEDILGEGNGENLSMHGLIFTPAGAPPSSTAYKIILCEGVSAGSAGDWLTTVTNPGKYVLTNTADRNLWLAAQSTINVYPYTGRVGP